MGRFDGKVVFVTGAARGQGRSHVLRFAAEGADVIMLDIGADLELVPYPLGTAAELDSVAEEIEALGRRVVARCADVRDAAAVRQVVAEGVETLGRLDVVVANAGIAPMTLEEESPELIFELTIAVNLEGVRNTVQAAAPQLIEQDEGGAVILTSSTQGLKGTGGYGAGATDGYVASKHGVVGLMRAWANWLAPNRVRVNSIHPTGVNTPMIRNEAFQEYLDGSPPERLAGLQNLLPVEAIEAADVTAAVCWLASDEARYVTGVTLPVDAGFNAR